tara:strand:- start:37 stop:1380 length:1344 start_codon:yes stop_codon:yes gene_type:complete
MYNISFKDIDQFHTKFNTPGNNIIKNAITSTSLEKILINHDKINQTNEIFSKEIQTEVSPSNQKSSGRCWLFALLNVIRLPMIKKYNLDKHFELSQTYLFFWDKLEKSNFFLHNIIKTRKLDIDHQYVRHLLTEPTNDGGQWNMLKNLVNKYGVIPKNYMKETYQSSNSYKLNDILNNKLRLFAYQIRNLSDSNFKQSINQKLKKMMTYIYKLLVIFLGKPPKYVSWEYYRKSKTDKKTYKKLPKLTPKQFYQKYVPFNVNDKICLINTPHKLRPFNQLYNIKFFGNVVGGENTNYINLPISHLKKYTQASIKNNEAVWFGCDVDKFCSTNLGILDIDAFDYDNVIGNVPDIQKGDKLLYHDSFVTHAMTFKGYNLNGNSVDKWLVENSWGKKTGNNGNFIMTNKWFDNYVYEVVIDKKYVDPKLLSILTQKPIELEPWDPIGNLLI